MINRVFTAIRYESVAVGLIFTGVGVAFITLIMLAVDMFWAPWIHANQDVKLSNFGQFLQGFVGSMWALAGIILFFASFRLQSDELRLQRTEMAENTKLLTRHNDILLQQNTEHSFFQLLQFHGEIISSMLIESETKAFKGRHCFSEFYRVFIERYTDTIDAIGDAVLEKEDMQAVINEAYSTFFENYQEDVGHYLENLKNLLLFIDSENISNKPYYIGILNAQVSKYELIMLFYCCLADAGTELKPLVEKYSFLKRLPEDKLLDLRHKQLFDEKAFG